MKTKNSVHFSSKSNEWETPSYVYNFLDKRFHFELDPASTDENHKCDIWFTKEEDGLNRDWKMCADSVFLNPPYGRVIGKWIGKSYFEATRGINVVILMPARTDTTYWHKYCMKANEIWFVKGRLHFRNKVIADYTGKTKTSPAPFPSAVVIFEGLTDSLPATPAIRSLYVNRKTKELGFNEKT